MTVNAFYNSCAGNKKQLIFPLAYVTKVTHNNDKSAENLFNGSPCVQETGMPVLAAVLSNLFIFNKRPVVALMAQCLVPTLNGCVLLTKVFNPIKCVTWDGI